jgi:hypothetical protein
MAKSDKADELETNVSIVYNSILSILSIAIIKNTKVNYTSASTVVIFTFCMVKIIKKMKYKIHICKELHVQNSINVYTKSSLIER